MDEKNQSVIGRLMTIVGEVICPGRLFVGGKINGKITADEIECCGHIEGDVLAGKFVMRKNGFHLGTVKTKLLEVDPGANMDRVLRSDLSTTADPSVLPVDLERVWSVFDEREKCRAMDVPGFERKELFEDLADLLEKGKPLIKIVGEKGSGKTTFIRLLAKRPAPGTKVFIINEPVGSVKDLLLTLAADMGIIPDKSESQKEIVQRIRDAVCGPGDKDTGIVLAVDDVHMMYPATMEGIIRSLTNVYGGDEGLLQLIFFGTDEIDRKLVHTTREYFEDETNCLLALEPLSVKDTAEYLRLCTQIASNNGAPICMSLFPRETITKLHIQSKGNISEINRLAGKALRSAFKAGVTEVDSHFI